MFKKEMIVAVVSLFMFSFALTSCKKEKGVCYCKYANGEKLEFDLNDVPGEAAQEDSCAVISNNASHFGGSCKLK